MQKRNKPFAPLVLSAILFFACGDIENTCDEFTEVHLLMQNTSNGIPRGYFELTIQGRIIRNYSPNLILALNNFLYWRDLYWYYCKKDDYYYRDDYYTYRRYGYQDYYYENALHYAHILAGYYRMAYNLYLDFDGASQFTIIKEPVDAKSTITPFVILSISNLTVGDVGKDILLNSSTPNRIFRIEFENDLFSSLETGSALTIHIHNIRPVGEPTLIDVKEKSVLYNDAGNMESVIIEGSLNPVRR